MDIGEQNSVLREVKAIEKWKGTAYQPACKGDSEYGKDYEGDEVYEALANLRKLAGEPYAEGE